MADFVGDMLNVLEAAPEDYTIDQMDRHRYSLPLSSCMSKSSCAKQLSHVLGDLARMATTRKGVMNLPTHEKAFRGTMCNVLYVLSM